MAGATRRPVLTGALRHEPAAGAAMPGGGGRRFVSTVTIYHNPAAAPRATCSPCIRNSGAEPRIVEYLKTPPSRAELVGLIERMGVPVRRLLRRKGTPFDALGLDDPGLGDDALLDAMVAHPILIERPIVATPLGVRLCRPADAVLDILPAP